MRSPLTVATAPSGPVSPSLKELVPKYTTEVARKATTTMRRMSFKLLKYSRIVLINAATSRRNSTATWIGATLPRGPRGAARAGSEQAAEGGQREVDRERGHRDPQHRVDHRALAPHELDE